MLKNSLKPGSYNPPQDDDFWVSGAMLITGTVACAAYVLVCVISLATPARADDMRASVSVGPVQMVALGDAMPATSLAALDPTPSALLRIAATGASAGCQKSVRATPR